jgi:hypothetical protein
MNQIIGDPLGGGELNHSGGEFRQKRKKIILGERLFRARLQMDDSGIVI